MKSGREDGGVVRLVYAGRTKDSINICEDIMATRNIQS